MDFAIFLNDSIHLHPKLHYFLSVLFYIHQTAQHTVRRLSDLKINVDRFFEKSKMVDNEAKKSFKRVRVI